MYIKWGEYDKNGFMLPVNPPSYEINGKQQNTSLNVHEFGEVNLKGKRALQTISWSCFFPNQRYNFVHCNPKDPIDYYVAKLEKLLEDNTTIHLIIGNKVNLYGTIESFSWGQGAGPGDVEYDISIKEMRPLGDKTRITKNIDYSITYTWKKGDTWKKVCKKYLKDASLWDWCQSQPENKKTIKAAKKAYKKAHPKYKKKTIKEEVALVGYNVELRYIPDEVVESAKLSLQLANEALERNLAERLRKLPKPVVPPSP